MKALNIVALTLVAAIFAHGCGANGHTILRVPSNELVCRSSYSFVYHGDGESYLYSLPENGAPIEPHVLSDLICRTLRPFRTSSVGTLHSDISGVPTLPILEQVKRVGSLFSEGARNSRDSDFCEFVSQFEPLGGWWDNSSEFHSLVKLLSKSAQNNRNKQPELRAIQLLILGDLYDYKYDKESDDIGHLKPALQIYTELADDNSAPAIYRAIALVRASNVLFRMKRYAEAREKVEEFRKKYDAYSEWPIYQDATRLRMKIMAKQGQNTFLTLMESCRKGDSRSVLATLGALSPERWWDLFADDPIWCLVDWVRKQAEAGKVTQESTELFEKLIGATYYPASIVRRIWLWWLQKRHNFPHQKLPEDMQESELIKEFVNEIRKDAQLAEQHKDLLDKALKDTEAMKKKQGE